MTHPAQCGTAAVLQNVDGQDGVPFLIVSSAERQPSIISVPFPSLLNPRPT